jgi:CRP-like cAMP-binding protein
MPGTSNLWFLRTTTLFGEGTDSLCHSVDRAAETFSFSRNDVISASDEASPPIYLLIEGQVKLRAMTDAGKEIITDIAGPGDAFGGLDRVVGPTGASGTVGLLPPEAVALTKGFAMKFSLEYFRHLVERRPTVVLNITRFFGLKQRRLEIRLTRLLFRSALGKVAGLLLELGERYGERTPQGIEVGVRLTHQELASLIGAKRETVSEALAELELRELITSSRGQLLLKDPEALDRIP